MSTAATRRGPRPGIVVLLVAFAVVVALALAIGRIDTDALRPRVEAAFERATGRVLRIDGHLRLALLPSPGFIASAISVSNLPGGSSPTMMSARSVRASLDLPALLRRQIHIESLVLDRPDLLLETVDGVPNWRFNPDRPATPTAAPAGDHHASFAFRVGAVDASGGQVRWNRVPRFGSGRLAIDTLHAQQQDGGNALTFYLDGHHGPAHLIVSAATGPDILAAAGAGRPVPLRATVTLGDERLNHLHVDGTVSASRFTGTLHGTLAQLADLDALFPHAALPAASNLRLDADIGQDGAGRWQILSGAASAGQADLDRVRPGLRAARLAIGITGPDRPATIDASGSLGPNSFTIKGLIGTAAFWREDAGTTPVDLAATFGPDRASLRGTLSRAGRFLDALDGAVGLALPEPSLLDKLFHIARPPPPLDVTGQLHAARDPAGGLQATLDASALSVRGAALPASTITFDAATHPASWQATAALPGAAKPWLVWREGGADPRHVGIDIDGHGLPAGPLSLLATGRRSVTGRLDLSATLQAQRTASGIDEATLDGPITARILDADIDAAVVRATLGDVLRVANLPRLPAATGHVRCAEAAGAFHDGALQLAHLSADASFISLTGSGTVDLARGSLDLHLRPLLSFGGTGLATAVNLAGPIDRPTASLQAGSGGRVGFQIGRLVATDTGACDGASGAPARHKQPKAVDILRGLGLLR